MLSDAEIELAANRLESGKLTAKDVDSLVSSFRTLLGPLEANYTLEADLILLDDSAVGSPLKASKMAAILIRLINEDFGVDFIDGQLKSSDDDQRRLLLIYGFTLLYPLPIELVAQDIYNRVSYSGRKSQSIDIVTIP
jgi:hypothetical protein